MTCKDCLNNEVCELYSHLYDAQDVEKRCKHIKNKSDFVEVVRCKDCKCCKKCYPAKAIGEKATVGWYCKIRRKYMRHDDFCSYGERDDSK